MLVIILTAFVKAISVVCWVGLLILILDYICAVVITQMIGHHAEWWGEHADEVRGWFGDIPKSMQSLFIVMTLAEWDTIADTLSTVIPAAVVWPFFNMYILIVAYSMTSLITGVISESLVAARLEDEKLQMAEMEEQKKALFEGLRKVLGSLDSNKNGELSRDELAIALHCNPQAIHLLALLGITMEEDDFMQLFEKLAKSSTDGNSIEVDSFVEALAALTGVAKAAALWDVKTDVADVFRKHQQLSDQLQRLSNKVDKDFSEVNRKLDLLVTALPAHKPSSAK
eukprot:gnl/TRDRNA2_/TRDRNA2_151058_c0_seq1.p1 gnl/TRDRNA2_/TRDRNA2_151058_c0~~gnl/TRDRNA2_/TRDRNA2_151058_c0_seq1.p1  ORF type:complete len:284 (-),score=57.93 gnl/TRDRNA2_/TRDRNA2_151058_c0_seq1:103-954(-)